MSNLILTAFAQSYAEEALKDLIYQYNNSDLTLQGKRDLLQEALMFAVMAGYNAANIKGAKIEEPTELHPDGVK